jgi:phosphoglycolate/pyridoxal phosphate phosphatase family enzyme
VLFVFDLDGVVYRGKVPVPGAAEALHQLEADRHLVFFLTNNATASRADYAARLGGMGIPATAERIMTSAYATGRYLQEQGAEGKAVYLVGERGLTEEMNLAGMRVLPEEGEEQADYVIVALDRQFTYAKLRRAQAHLQGGARFIATNRDRTLPLEGGLEIPGGGSMVAALEACARPPEITIGKPEPYTWLEILSLAGSPPSQSAMVGDRAETDIFGAKRVGMQTVLVLTGATRAEDVPRLPPEQQPDHVLDSIAELPALVRSWAI